MTTNFIQNQTDGELIDRYRQSRSDSDLVMRELVGRYQQQVHSRFRSKVNNDDDANDLQQELWSRVARSLDRYKDEQKFAYYLNKLASNVLIDFYRKTGRDKSAIVNEGDLGIGSEFSEDEGNRFTESFADPMPDAEVNTENDELIQHLVSVLVPSLPVEQRAAWLLRHESEYWEPGRRLEWHHLAELNDMNEQTTAAVFESARNKLMVSVWEKNGSETKPTVESSKLDGLELLVFLVWTQAQRIDKSDAFTWEYFAELLGQPVNTMKTRYRSAQKALEKGLAEFMHS